MKCLVQGLILLSLGMLLSCAEREGLAPVEELTWSTSSAFSSSHRVLRGETLYAIAFKYDMDYRQLARLNHLKAPYTLKVGQKLYLKGKSPKVSARIKSYKTKPTPRVAQQVSNQPFEKPISSSKWGWPAKGKIVANYAPHFGKKGINIAGRQGQKIHAAASGVVAYSGDGLPGYGNLIIIKHSNQFLTAYANNARNLVKEGQTVKLGQIIADMGVVDRRYWGVHFEIRKGGKPVNPLPYLQKG